MTINYRENRRAGQHAFARQTADDRIIGGLVVAPSSWCHYTRTYSARRCYIFSTVGRPARFGSRTKQKMQYKNQVPSFVRASRGVTTDRAAVKPCQRGASDRRGRHRRRRARVVIVVVVVVIVRYIVTIIIAIISLCYKTASSSVTYKYAASWTRRIDFT